MKSPAIRPIALLFAANLLAVSSAHAFKCVPIYGNWCGPGHPNTVALPPIDVFDAACMRHDYCVGSPVPETVCDRNFVIEINQLAAQIGYLPRPLQWAEYVIRLKSGGGWGGMPLPLPDDAAGLMSSILTPCP